MAKTISIAIKMMTDELEKGDSGVQQNSLSGESKSSTIDAVRVDVLYPTVDG
jgi:hypothetical protein